jgi:hypothetical protein
MQRLGLQFDKQCFGFDTIERLNRLEFCANWTIGNLKAELLCQQSRYSQLH